jgi:hypothetical protein
MKTKTQITDDNENLRGYRLATVTGSSMNKQVQVLLVHEKSHKHIKHKKLIALPSTKDGTY